MSASNNIIIIYIFAGVIFVLYGCVPVDIEHQPDVMNEDYLESLHGSTYDEIVSQFGQPKKEFQQNNKNFLIYVAYGDFTGWLFPLPIIFPGDDLAEWCILLEFSDDGILKNSEMFKKSLVRFIANDCTNPNLHWDLLISPAARLAAERPRNEIGVLVLDWDWRAYKIQRNDPTGPSEEGDYNTLKRLNFYTGDKPVYLPPGSYTIMFKRMSTSVRSGSFQLTVEPGHEYEIMVEECTFTCPRPPIPAMDSSGAWVWIEDKTTGTNVSGTKMFSW